MQLDDIPVIRQRNRGDRSNAENPDYSNEINRQNELKTSQDSSQSRSRSRTRSRSKTSKSTGKDSDERKRKSKSRSRSRTRARTETETKTRPSSRSRSPTIQTTEEKKDTDPYLSSAGIRQSNYQGQSNATDDETQDSKTKAKQSSKRGQRKSNERGKEKGKKGGNGNGKCNGHHADKDVEELSDDELHLIRNNNALAILYDFVSMIAGSDRRHYRKCGCVGKMPISHLWIVSDRDPMWTRRKKGINVLNFEESWSSFLTGAAQSAINSALHMIRQCKNPDTDKIPIVLLMSHKDLKSPFQNLVTCILQGSNDPRNSQSVSREAIVGIFDIEAYYFAWFGTAKVKNEIIAGEERRTWYIP